MIDSAFELGEEIKLRQLAYSLHPELWVKYDLTALDLNFENWQTIKYLNDAGTQLNTDVENLIPNNKGGLYMFSIDCPVIVGRTEYPVYIGRAFLTEHQNLRKRCKEYFQKFARSNERPKITKMFKYWKHELYLSFYPIDENDDIENFEKKLINSLLLPFNDQIPDAQIAPAVKAFQT